ncbi:MULTISPECIES: MerR family transcriptional regulator [Bradyrhizobium]|uniref:MerR family transcriptional regulator n=1 Tax=Bradyrhizobium TaxID=374 RepID=UPI00040210F6|nr:MULTISPECIES: MerR family transcriptional regulator [Bradyrhizobium]MBO4222453.1 MerR family transcriptional regulator [Bradyrhizobium neotropicale]
MEKAPDAFRTISEVADELDIPQHVLRFWETRFAQIKPMKRSGGRRYYRPDDVDLLKGIRRLLYGEGYTIRGVQRILKEHGIKSVQAISDQSAAISFGAVEEAIGQSLRESDEEEETAGQDNDAEDEEFDDGNAIEIDYRFVDPDEDGILAPFKGRQAPAAQPTPAAAPARGIPAADRERLQRALQDLIGCREMLDLAMKDGEGR